MPMIAISFAGVAAFTGVAFAGLAANGEKVEETPARRTSPASPLDDLPRSRERFAPLRSEDLYSPPDHSERDQDASGGKGVFQGR